MRPRTKLLGLSAIAACLLVVAGCGGDDKTSEGTTSAGGTTPGASTPINDIFGAGGEAAGQGKTINVGMVLAMTGPGAFTGKVMSQGAKLAAEQIKAAGGPDFKISIADHQGGLVPPGVSGARRLINQDGVAALLSSYGGVTKALIPLVAQSKVLTFNPGGPDPTQAGSDFLWLPSYYYADDATPGGLGWLAKKYPKAKRLVIVATAENGVNAVENLVPKYWPQIQPGGTVVGTEIHNVGVTDFSQIVARIKAAKADAVWTASFGNDVGYLMKQLRQAGVTAPVLGNELSPEACKVAPSEFDSYAFAGGYFDPTKNPWSTSYAAAYKQKYNEDAEVYGTLYYESTFLLWELVKRVIAAGGDPTSGAELQDALVQDPTFKTIFGGSPDEVATMTFDTTEHSVTKPLGVFVVKGCKAQQAAEIKKIGPDDKPADAIVSMK